MPEPRDKLDTTTVNGPEDEVLDWDAVNWRQAGDNVRRMRERAFTGREGRGPNKGPHMHKIEVCFLFNPAGDGRRGDEGEPGRHGYEGGGGRPASAWGRWAGTWPTDSTESITPIFSASSARSPPGDGSSSG